jgi:hypothetical protein
MGFRKINSIDRIQKTPAEYPRLCPFGHRTSDFFEIGDAPFGSVTHQ